MSRAKRESEGECGVGRREGDVMGVLVGVVDLVRGDGVLARAAGTSEGEGE